MTASLSSSWRVGAHGWGLTLVAKPLTATGEDPRTLAAQRSFHPKHAWCGAAGGRLGARTQCRCRISKMAKQTVAERLSVRRPGPMDGGYDSHWVPVVETCGCKSDRYIWKCLNTGRFAVSLLYRQDDGSMGHEFKVFNQRELAKHYWDGFHKRYVAHIKSRQNKLAKRKKRAQQQQTGNQQQPGAPPQVPQAKGAAKTAAAANAPAGLASASPAAAAAAAAAAEGHKAKQQDINHSTQAPAMAVGAVPAEAAPQQDSDTHPAAMPVPAVAAVPYAPKSGDKLEWSCPEDQQGRRHYNPQLLQQLGFVEEPPWLLLEVLGILGSGATAWVVAADVKPWITTQQQAAAAGGPPPHSVRVAAKIYKQYHEVHPALRGYAEELHDDLARTWRNQEMEVLQLGGPYLPTYYARGSAFDLSTDVERYVLLMELVPGGSLDQVIKSSPKPKGLPRSDIKSYMRDMVAGLALLHRHNYIYRDLKPYNALLATNTDGTHTIKLTDFGTSRKLQLEAGGELTMGVGSMLYWAPEQASRQRYGSPADIWALGPTLLHLLKGRPPWYFLRPHQQHKRWEYATLKQAWCPYIKEDEDGEALGPEELQFLYQVMQQNPKDRPTAVELLAYSPYLRKAG